MNVHQNQIAMTTKRKEQKKQYEIFKDIRARFEAGEPTTFAERNIMFIYLKKMEKKQKERVLATI